MSVKVGDVVLYRAFGREVNALVLRVNTSTPSHLGKDKEPALTLAFVDPERERAIAPKKNVTVLLPETHLQQIHVEHDVVHSSHEFDAEFLKKHGSTPAQVASQRGHGEWLWLDENEAEDTPQSDERDNEPDPDEAA